jgi:hypothetical protein
MSNPSSTHAFLYRGIKHTSFGTKFHELSVELIILYWQTIAERKSLKKWAKSIKTS